MIPDLRFRGLMAKAKRVRPVHPVIVILVLLAVALAGACHKVPLFAPTGASLTLYAGTQVLPLNGTTQVTANVVESGGIAVQDGTQVTFTSSLGSFTPSDAGTKDGKATVTFNAGSQSGTAVINAFSGAVSTSGSGSVSIVIGAAPTVTITTPTSPTAGIAATFTLNVAPGAGAAAISDVTVNFGDATAGSIVDLGAVSGAINVSHAYASPQQYTVTATVRDGSGQTVSVSTPVTVYAAVPFTLSVTASPSTAASNVTLVVFTATPNANAPAISNYTWDFGDGTKVQTTVPFASHTYTGVPNGSPSQQLLVSVTATGAAPDTRVGYGSVAITVTQ